MGEHRIETNRKKIGAFLGDYVEVGCNSVLNPGTIIGRNSNIYPVSCVRGIVPENSKTLRGQYSGRNGNYVRTIRPGALLILGVLGIKLYTYEHS